VEHKARDGVLTGIRPEIALLDFRQQVHELLLVEMELVDEAVGGEDLVGDDIEGVVGRSLLNPEDVKCPVVQVFKDTLKVLHFEF